MYGTIFRMKPKPGQGQSVIDIYIRCETSQFSLEDLSNKLNLSIFSTDASFGEKLHLPSSIRFQEDRKRILVKLKPDYNMDDEEFGRFLNDAYKSFKTAKNDGTYWMRQSQDRA